MEAAGFFHASRLPVLVLANWAIDFDAIIPSSLRAGQ
jgi:hypothetical protein